MENLLQTVEQFLEFSDEKLEELSKKNQTLKLEEFKKERGDYA
ncbi:SP_0009 family protein [Streptococcus constellatus]|nr:SP_0009 family protein [Streptococcus constellatus]